MGLNLGWYSPVHFRPVVEGGQIVQMRDRVFLCDECAKIIGADKADEGTFSNLRWWSKGYEVYSGECLCGKEIEGGKEVWLVVDVKTV